MASGLKAYAVEDIEREWKRGGWDAEHPSVRHAIATEAFRRCGHEDTEVVQFDRRARSGRVERLYVKRCKGCGGYASPSHARSEAGALPVSMNNRGHLVAERAS